MKELDLLLESFIEENQQALESECWPELENLLHKEDLYKECRFLQQQIKEKNQKIKEIKNSLDSGDEKIDRKTLNKNISERINELNILKSKFSELLSPSNMYSRISQNLLEIVISYELADLINSEKDGDLIAESVKLRQKLTDKLGYVIPGVHFVISDEINENEYAINVRNMKIFTGLVYPEHRRFFTGQSNLENMPEEAIEDIDTISGKQVFWLEESKTKSFWDNGLTASQVIINYLEFIVCKYVDEILNYGDILNYIAILGEENSFLVENLEQKAISIGDLRYIFANLIKEKISVKDIVFIFEKLNDLSEQEYDNDKLLEKLRLLMKRQICSSIADSDNIIYAITIPEKYKKILSESLKKINGKNEENEELNPFIKYVTDIFMNCKNNYSEIALITKPEHRKLIFNLFEQILPELHVLSEDEIAEEFNIEEI